MLKWEYYLSIIYLFTLVIFLTNGLLITYFIAVCFLCSIVMSNKYLLYQFQRLKKKKIQLIPFFPI